MGSYWDGEDDDDGGYQGGETWGDAADTENRGAME
jgi:hypothetical protein